METRESFKKEKKIIYVKLRLKKVFRNNLMSYTVYKTFSAYIIYLFWIVKTFIRRGEAKFISDEIKWVSPGDIVYCTLKEFNPHKYDGVVMGGDWDRLEKKFHDLDVFIAFKAHFIDKVEWKDTKFYKNIVYEINEKHFCFGCLNEQDLIERCKRHDKLFKEIKENGYKTQKDLTKKFVRRKALNEISVNIGRNGDYLFNNGAHRLSIAKLLNIDKIPIRITVRHKNY